ncbi:ketopantoate reductase PanE/ApbA C terminal-domain-containing protein [Coniochaeta sp. 2T2.1]|nr:ketopantoate reductase PanE/ApbA C terminal-domain-containing protein [Coniochaeta sp. 2T2.1]
MTIPQLRLAASTPHRLSDQVHVLGSDIRGRYITHALACREALPPVRFLTHRKDLQAFYGRAGNRLVLHNGDETIETQLTNIGSTEDGGLISNLVVTVPAESVVRSIRSIVHRIQPTTTICLLQDGLGVMEAVNDACFRNEVEQPFYVLGHMSHVLGVTQSQAFTVSEIKQGKLYLAAVGHDPGDADITYHPPIERNRGISHFLELMTTTPRLQAGGYTLQKFMEVKLRDTIALSVIEPLTVVLDCSFGELATNNYARQMIDQLLGEILSVVARMPEVKDSLDMRWMMLYGEMRRDVFRRLERLKDKKSRMRSATDRGFSSDIDFLNGYFVERGRELGIKCPVNESVIWMVKAKHQQSLAKIRKARLEQLKAQAGAGGNSGGGSGQQQQQAQQRQ